MEWGDYFCLLAESLDAEELEDYSAYILAGGEKKKWKWSSPDKAGTANQSKDAPRNSLMKFKNILERRGGVVAKGTGLDFARATGRPIVLMNPDGVYFDEQANTVNPPFKVGTVVVKVDYEGNPR